MSKKSRDAAKLGNFFNFEVTSEKFFTAQDRARKQSLKHFRNAFIFGFLIELMIIKTRICK